MKQRVRLWLFRIATAMTVPAILVVGAEAGLRLIGYGHRSDFTVPIELDTAHARAAELQYNLRYARAELSKGSGSSD